MSLNDSDVDDEYHNLFEEINREESECQKLKKDLTTCENSIQVLNVLNNPSFSTRRLYQVRVKVFRSLTDLLKIYPEKVTHNEFLAPKYHGMNLYLIEVYVSQLFYEKSLSMDWIADFIISNSNYKLCKSMNLKKNAANPITTVMPFPRCRTNDEVVKVNLTSARNWRQVELGKVHTDISFKFNAVEDDKTIKLRSIEQDVLKINGIYNSTIKNQSKESRNYRLRCQLNTESFTDALVLNSYHNLNPSQIIGNEGNRATKIEINDRQVHLELDARKNSLRIEAPGEELCQLKRYFTGVNGDSFKYTRKDFLHMDSVNALKDARTKLKENLQYNQIRILDLMNVYDVYQRFVDGCPL